MVATDPVDQCGGHFGSVGFLVCCASPLYLIQAGVGKPASCELVRVALDHVDQSVCGFQGLTEDDDCLLSFPSTCHSAPRCGQCLPMTVSPASL